jgi:catechol 2,3-dioxygenase-like lactoylglutathione lyase family enzyme
MPPFPGLDHVSAGVTDFARSKAFYDRVLPVLGLTYAKGREGHAAGYGTDGHAFFWITKLDAPHPGTGIHFAFAADSREQVDRFHAEALAGGAADNGAPGVRPLYTQPYYAAFVIDFDGNRLEAVCRKPA